MTLRPTTQQRDAVVAAWCLIWLGLGAWVGYDLWQLADVTTTVANAGTTLHTIGDTLHQLSSVPFVGSRVGHAGDQITQTARQITQTATGDRPLVHQLAVLLGFAVGIIPLTPVLGWYLPTRLRRARSGQSAN